MFKSHIWTWLLVTPTKDIPSGKNVKYLAFPISENCLSKRICPALFADIDCGVGVKVAVAVGGFGVSVGGVVLVNVGETRIELGLELEEHPIVIDIRNKVTKTVD